MNADGRRSIVGGSMIIWIVQPANAAMVESTRVPFLRTARFLRPCASAAKPPMKKSVRRRSTNWRGITEWSMSETGKLILRVAGPEDVAAIAELTRELGYPTGEDIIRARLGRLQGRSDQAVWVATDAGVVLGWLQAYLSEVLESGTRVEIVGLVVARQARRQGVGRALVQQAEAWARQLGAEAIVVRSNTKRIESHQFYPAMGFEHTKIQAVYRKRLTRVDRP
jgi:GNAT superfamily N-acetyltransferase